ncbi:LOW QUALITY PROTEIN: hypothetical protein V2J09_009156, partial [Rumex salicifolius]
SEQPICGIFSEKLSFAKRNYRTYENEFYAVLQAVKQWRNYLFHLEFLLFTDHDFLKHLHYQEKLSPKHGQRMAYLEQFTFVMKHKAGDSNRADDALSRCVNILVHMHVEVLIFFESYSIKIRSLRGSHRLSNKGKDLTSEFNGEGHVGLHRTLELVQT